MKTTSTFALLTAALTAGTLCFTSCGKPKAADEQLLLTGYQRESQSTLFRDNDTVSSTSTTAVAFCRDAKGRFYRYGTPGDDYNFSGEGDTLDFKLYWKKDTLSFSGRMAFNAQGNPVWNEDYPQGEYQFRFRKPYMGRELRTYSYDAKGRLTGMDWDSYEEETDTLIRTSYARIYWNAAGDVDSVFSYRLRNDSVIPFHVERYFYPQGLQAKLPLSLDQYVDPFYSFASPYLRTTHLPDSVATIYYYNGWDILETTVKKISYTLDADRLVQEISTSGQNFWNGVVKSQYKTRYYGFTYEKQ